MTNFEVYNDTNDQKVSLIIKLFFWKYFTTSIIPFVSDMHLPFLESDFGFYDDITPFWYRLKGGRESHDLLNR